MNRIDSVAFFKPHWLCWKILGAVSEGIRYKSLYLVYGIIANIMVTLCYPIHLLKALFNNGTLADDFKNLALCVTCTACSVKFIIYTMKLKKVHEMEEILRLLDARVESPDERTYFQKSIRQNVRNIAYLFLCVYMIVGVTAELGFIVKEERGLLYPAWFPFSWQESSVNYTIANVYQIVGIFFQLIMNFVDDCFPPMALCLLSGHIKLLAKRMSKIGYETEDLRENERELHRCIVDQKNLYRLFDVIQGIFSVPMFIQFGVTACNGVLAMVALIFYVESALDLLYYFVYFLAMPLQIFPTCYYGSDFQLQFSELHCAVYASNWFAQNRVYRKNMIIFTERSLKETTAIAGGMLRIHLDTFFSTCKGAYSLFALVMRLKN